MILWVVAVSSVLGGTAQDLANADRELVAAQKTGLDVGAAQARVDRLSDAWLREEAEATERFGLEERVLRFIALLNEAHRRHRDQTERALEQKATPSLEAWLQHEADAVAQHQPMRALAFRQWYRNALPAQSPLSTLRSDLDTTALTQLAPPDSSTATVYAFDALKRLATSQEVTLPTSLHALRFLEEAPALTSACQGAVPTLNGMSQGVRGRGTIGLSACQVSENTREVSRSCSYQVTEMQKVKRIEKQMVTRMVPTAENRTACSATCTDEYRNAGPCAMSACPAGASYTYPVIVDKPTLVEENVEVERIEPVVVTHTETYRVTERTTRATVSATLHVEGDAMLANAEPSLQATFADESFQSTHCGTANFSARNQTEAIERLQPEVTAAWLSIQRDWARLRGERLERASTSLTDTITAAVLQRKLTTPLIAVLGQATGATEAELGVLLEPHRASLTPPPDLKGMAPRLPEAELSVRQNAETEEYRGEVFETQHGYMGGLELGVATVESQNRDGLLRFGFAGQATFGFRLAVLTQNLHLRAVLSPSISVIGGFHLTGVARAEVGFRARGFIIAAFGAGHFQFTWFTDEQRDEPAFETDKVFATPTSAGGGYGAFIRIPLSLASWRGSGGDTTGNGYGVTPGLELIGYRFHETSREVPLLTRAEARAYLDLGNVARITLGAVITSQDDVPRFFSGHFRQMMFMLGIGSDY